MAPRAYTSPIRDAQVEQTRQRLLDTTHTILTHDGLDALTLPRLAQAASVSVPTVYRHFPTVDDLLRAYLEWLRPRVGQTAERLLQATPDELPTIPLGNFAAYEEHARALLAVMESPTFNRIRVGSMSDRARRGADVLRERAPGWSEDELEAAAGAIYTLASPQTWRWMRETWRLDANRAARAASWAMRALIDALGKQRGLERPFEGVTWTRRTPAATKARRGRAKKEKSR
jgi:AcrR family transcriptional regulator